METGYLDDIKFCPACYSSCEKKLRLHASMSLGKHQFLTPFDGETERYSISMWCTWWETWFELQFEISSIMMATEIEFIGVKTQNICFRVFHFEV